MTPTPTPLKAVPGKAPYEPPRITWEQKFTALAASTPPPCIPGQDPRCTP